MDLYRNCFVGAFPGYYILMKKQLIFSNLVVPGSLCFKTTVSYGTKLLGLDLAKVEVNYNRLFYLPR